MALSNFSTDMAEIEVSALKEALLTQHQIMQNLHLELEEERESAATAASEALSMILRLQGEKAAAHMEARQYKRMTEEKLHHAEESVAVFEELLCRKELEIAFLEFQIQAYRHKLLSIGFPDIEVSGHGIGRRASLPVMKLNFSRPDIAINQKNGPSISFRHMTTGNSEGDQDSGIDIACDTGSKFFDEISPVPEESAVEDFLEKMDELGEQAKALSHSKHCDEIPRRVSAGKEACANMAAYSASSKSESGCRCGFQLQRDGSMLCSNSCAEDGLEFNKRCAPPRVRDVYAVSQYQKQVAQNVMSTDAAKEMETIPNHTTEDNGNERCKLSKRATCVQRELEISIQPDVATTNFHLLPGDPKIDRPLKESDMVEIRNRVMKLENVIDTMKLQELDKETEEMKLLRQINEQIESIRSQIINPKAEKRSAPKKSMDSLIEAMLSFSI